MAQAISGRCSGSDCIVDFTVARRAWGHLAWIPGAPVRREWNLPGDRRESLGRGSRGIGPPRTGGYRAGSPSILEADRSRAGGAAGKLDVGAVRGRRDFGPACRRSVSGGRRCTLDPRAKRSRLVDRRNHSKRSERVPIPTRPPPGRELRGCPKTRGFGRLWWP